jgi:hypothetical protein
MNKEGMKMERKILRLLYRSFDDELDEGETKRLAEALRKSEALRKERDRIRAQRQAIAESPKPSFESHFAERVMGRIDALKDKKNGMEAFYEALLTMFRRLALAGAAILLLLLIYNLRTGDALSTDDIFYSSDIAIEEISNFPLF